MFTKFFIAILFVLTALSATACGQLQLPTSLPQLPTDTRPSIAPNPAPDQSAQTNSPPGGAPGSGPETGKKDGKGEKAPAVIFEMLHRLGWEGGIVAKVSDNQIVLRTLRGPFLGAPEQNPPGLNQRGQNQPDSNQPGSNQPNPNPSGPNAPNRRGRDQTETINVNSSTIFVVPGKSHATLSDIHVGDRLIADVPRGQRAAALVMDAPKDYKKDNVVLGMVQSNSNGTLTLRTRGGSDTVTTSATTQVIKVNKDGVTAGAVSDLQTGDPVVVIGQESGEDFSAQVIFALPKGLMNLGNPPGKDKKNIPPPQPPAPNPGG